MGAMIATMAYLDPVFNLSCFLYFAFTAESFLCELQNNGIFFVGVQHAMFAPTKFYN